MFVMVRIDAISPVAMGFREDLALTKILIFSCSWSNNESTLSEDKQVLWNIYVSFRSSGQRSMWNEYLVDLVLAVATAVNKIEERRQCKIKVEINKGATCLLFSLYCWFLDIKIPIGMTVVNIRYRT